MLFLDARYGAGFVLLYPLKNAMLGNVSYKKGREPYVPLPGKGPSTIRMLKRWNPTRLGWTNSNKVLTLRQSHGQPHFYQFRCRCGCASQNNLSS